MNKFISILLMACMALSVQANGTHLKGTFHKIIFQNQTSNTALFTVNENGNIKAVTAAPLRSSDRTFDIKIGDETGLIGKVVFFGNDGEFYPLYLAEGDSINIFVNNGNIQFNGKLCPENKFISEWFNIMAKLRELDYTMKGRQVTAAYYKEVLDSIAPLAEEHLKNINTGNKIFDNYMKKLMPYYLQYDALSIFINGIYFNQKSDYPKYLQNLFDNYKYDNMDVWNYFIMPTDLLINYAFGRETVYNFKQGIPAPMMMENIQSNQLREAFGLEALKRGFFFDEAEKVMKQYDYCFTDEKMKAERDRILVQYRVNKPGNDWVDFAYEDINGKKHHLSDYLGQVVVVDVWATWCGPCKRELPSLEQLEKEMAGKKVTFISLSVDQNKNTWKNYIQEKKLKGIQLISFNKGPIVDIYKVNSIPRFMVFSKKGKTVSTDAPRPSTPDLKRMIEQELTK